MNELSDHKERSTERDLRDILGPLDRHLEMCYTVLGTALLGVVPTTFLLLWLILEYSGKHALGWSVAAFGGVIVLGIVWDTLAGWLARWQFERRFPLGSAEREEAIRLLAEMETPSRAEERLRNAVSASYRIVRHRQRSTLPAADAVPAIDPQPPAGPFQRVAGGPALGRGGYYDYIPLDLRPRGEE